MYIFETATLPSGFEFPVGYLELLQSGLPDIEPWWWLAPHKDSSIYWKETLGKQFPQRMLVPFAKDGGSDDVACFEGGSQGEQPKVLIIHSFCTPGWEHRGEFENFSEWLKHACAESASFRDDVQE